MSILKTESREICGKLYTVRVLNVAHSRAVFARLQKLLAMMGDDDLKAAQMDALLMAGLAGQLSEEDLKFYCDTFSQYTSVDTGDGRTLGLKDPKNQDEVFAGEPEAMFEWIGFCIEVNFRGVIAKMKAALLALADQVQAKKATEQA